MARLRLAPAALLALIAVTGCLTSSSKGDQLDPVAVPYGLAPALCSMDGAQARTRYQGYRGQRVRCLPMRRRRPPPSARELRDLARRIMRMPWNRPGTDKTWVIASHYNHRDLLKEIEKARRAGPR